MTDEERDIITRFIQRVSGAPQGGSGFAGGSVPATAPALPPVDPEADRLIADLFARYPEARYRMTQTAFAQEAALAQAQNRIRQLEYQVQQMQHAMQPPPQGSQPAQGGGGFLSGLFGGHRQAPQPPPGQPGSPWGQAAPPPGYGAPPPQYAPPQGVPPQMFQRGGSGFLGSALTTAAGVAGGMVAGNALMDLFSGHHGLGGGFGGAGAAGAAPSETVINNYYGSDPAQDASLPPPPDPGQDPGQDPWGGQVGGGWDQAGSPDFTNDPGGGWQDTSFDPGFDNGGGFDDTQDV